MVRSSLAGIGVCFVLLLILGSPAKAQDYPPCQGGLPLSGTPPITSGSPPYQSFGDLSASAGVYINTNGAGTPTGNATVTFRAAGRICLGPGFQAAATASGGTFTAVIGAPVQVSQSISFGALNNQMLSSPPPTLSATATSGLPVIFTSGTPTVCTVAGLTLNFINPGTCSITASQSGNVNYSAAVPVTRSFVAYSLVPVSFPSGGGVNFVQILPGGAFNSVYADDSWLAVQSSGGDLIHLGTPANPGASRHTTLHATLVPSSGNTVAAGIVITQDGDGLSPLSITTTSLSSVRVGNVYPATQLAATGGTGSYTWSVSSGTLPTGMYLDSSGILHGVPTVAGTSTFTVRVNDNESAPVTQSLSIAVSNATVSLVVSGKTPPHYSDGDTFTLTVTGPPNAVVSVGDNGGAPQTLPGWTTNAAGVYSASATWHGAVGGILGPHSQVWTVGPYTADPSPLVFYVDSLDSITITTLSLPPAVVGTAYTPFTLQATGGTGTLTWSKTAGSLPAGMTLSSSGQLSGTPATGTANSYPITVHVVDGASHAADAALTLVVAAATPAADPVFSPASQTFSSPFTVTLSSPGADIYYTTDGSTPSSTNGTKSSSLTVSATETVKAIAIQSGHPDSNVTSATYTQCQPLKEFIHLNGRVLAVETSCVAP